MEHYWLIELWDGETIRVKPSNVHVIQKKVASAEGAINTRERSIMVKNIKDFRETSEVYSDQQLLEAGARAFKEPLIEDDAVMMVWVKKTVTHRDYSKYYSHHSAYRKISETDGRVTIMWRQPTHLVDWERMQELTPDEERNLAVKI